MQIVSDISLKDFGFWSGAKDTADQLTDEQFDRVEQILEENQPEGGWTDTAINDLFWFDSDQVLEWAGYYPKYYRLTANSGLVSYVAAADSHDVEEVKNAPWNFAFEEVDEEDVKYENVEGVCDFDFEGFTQVHYFKITSYIGNNEAVVRCDWDYCADDLKKAFAKCKIEELHSEDGAEIKFDYDWEIDFENDPRAIDRFVYDEDEMFNSYNIPTYALCPIENGDWDSDELTEEDVQNIRKFLDNLDRQMPNGWTMDWEDLDDPFFDPYPKFGLPCDCFKVRVYPINKIDGYAKGIIDGGISVPRQAE